MLTGPFTMWGFIYRLSLFIYIYINTCILYPSFILHCSPSISHHSFYRMTTYLAYKYVRVIHITHIYTSCKRDFLTCYNTPITELKDDRMENSINGSRYRHILRYCGGCARRYGPGPPLLHAATPYPTHTQSCCLLHKLETPVC